MKSNRKLAAQAPVANTATETNHSAAFAEIQRELLQAKTLSALQECWIKKCYTFERREFDKSIQNAIRILANRARWHLQVAKSIADHIGKQDSPLYDLMQSAEADLLLLSVPWFYSDPEEILARLSICEDFTENLKNALSTVGSELSSPDGKPGRDFDRNEVDFSGITPLSSYDFEGASHLDTAYSFVVGALLFLNTHTEKGLADNVNVFRSELLSLPVALKAILSVCDDEKVTRTVTHVLNHLDFIEGAFDKNLINAETVNKYRSTISAILTDASSALSNIAKSANRAQAEEILKSRGDDADDSLH